MATSTTKTEPDETAETDATADDAPRDGSERDDYVLPIVHVRVPSTMVNVGFWGGLAGAVVLGAVDLPLGVLMGAGVVVARHRTRPADDTDGTESAD